MAKDLYAPLEEENDLYAPLEGDAVSGPMLQKDFPEITSIPHKLPKKVIAQLYTGARASDVAKMLKSEGYDVFGENEEYPTVTIDGQIYNINKPGLSVGDVLPMPYQGAMAIPGARIASTAAKAAGAGLKALGARVLGQAGTDVVQNVAEQQAQAMAVGEGGRPIDIGETATVAGLGAIGTLAERGIGRIAKRINAPQEGRALEGITSGLITPKQLEYGLELEKARKFLSPFQVQPLLENRSKALAANAVAREKIATAMGAQSDQSRKAVSDFIENISPLPPAPIGTPSAKQLIDSLDRGSPNFSEQMSKLVKSEKWRIKQEGAADWGAIKTALADSSVPPIDMAPVILKINDLQKTLKDDSSSFASLEKVKRLLTSKEKRQLYDADDNPILGKYETVDTTIWPKDKDIFDVKYEIQDIINGKKESLGIVNRHTANNLADIVKDIDTMIDDQISSNPSLVEAKKRYAANKKDLRLLESSRLGQIAEAYDLDAIGAQRSAQKVLFSPDSEIDENGAKLLSAFMRRTPEGNDAMNELLADHISKVKGTAKDVVVHGEERIEGLIDNTPGGYYNAIFGQKERPKAVMYSMMTTDQKANAAALEKYLLLASVGRKSGSDTMPKLAGEAELARESALAALRGGAGITAKTAQYIGDIFLKTRTDKAKIAIAEAIINPQWASEMTKYRQFVHMYDRTFEEGYLRKATDILASIIARSSGQSARQEE